jgi:hypothetical protein
MMDGDGGDNSDDGDGGIEVTRVMTAMSQCAGF